MKSTAIPMMITGLMVKSYMAISLAWTIADAFYNNLKSFTAVKEMNTKISTAQPAV